MAEDEETPTEAEGQPAEEQPAEEQPAGGQPAEAEGQPAEEAQAPEETPAAEAPEEAPAAEAPAEAAEEPPAQERPARRERQEEAPSQPEVVPGAHLEPDLVLEQQAAGDEEDYSRYASPDEEGDSEAAATVEEEAAPVPRSTIDLAADARYTATGKRKTAIARVIVKPGSGAYQINGRTLEEFFPRQTLQRTARQPLETAGYDTRMDVVARIQGGGVSAQAGALRHGISRALVEADPNLRTELKRRGFLTRDAREKERKKAGLKKARKRPQFSKR